MSCRHLPSQFACHVRSPDAILSTLNKEEIKARCRELGAPSVGSLSQMTTAVADAVVARGQTLPKQFVALNALIVGDNAFRHGVHSGAEDHAGGSALGPCWLCGASARSVGLENLADFQVGSWPPGDARRWQFGGSCVIPVAVCQGCSETGAAPDGSVGATLSKDDAAAPPAAANRLSLSKDVLELRTRLYRPKTSHRLTCRVGDFPTIASVFWDGCWRTLDETLTLCTGEPLPDAVVACPLEASIERVCLQLLNWFSMSGLDKADKNCLPARVYLTRPARLVCRAGQVVGYMTYTATGNEHFPIPTLCAIYVRPEARGKGACRALMYEFVHLARAAKKREGMEGSAEVSGDTSQAAPGGEDDVTGGDCEMYGIEAPVSSALLSALPKMFKPSMLKRFRVIQHGDSAEQVRPPSPIQP